MILEARFASYNPSYSVSEAFTINVVDTCSKTAITANTNITFYHLIGQGSTIYEILPKWTDSYNGVCG